MLLKLFDWDMKTTEMNSTIKYNFTTRTVRKLHLDDILDLLYDSVVKNVHCKRKIRINSRHGYPPQC